MVKIGFTTLLPVRHSQPNIYAYLLNLPRFSLCTIITYIPVLVVDYGGRSLWTYDIMLFLGPVSSWIGQLGDILILLFLVELALSFLRASGKPGQYRAIMIPTFVAVAILSVLSMAALGVSEDYGKKTLDYLHSSSYLNYPSWENTGKVIGSWIVLNWITALAVIALSTLVFSKSLRNRKFTGVSSSWHHSGSHLALRLILTPIPARSLLLRRHHP
jgi:hypothetical protein